MIDAAERERGIPWPLLMVAVFWAFIIGIASSDAIAQWLASPKALRTISAEYQKAAERKEKVAKFYDELEHGQ